MRPLTRTITADDSHDDTGHSKEKHYENNSFHMISVPCILPSMSAMAIADMNMPAMIHTMSISTIPIEQS